MTYKAVCKHASSKLFCVGKCAGNMSSHYNHPLYVLNSGKTYHMPTIPLPDPEGMPLMINTYDDVDEPRFNPKIHLDLREPEYIRVLPYFKKAKTCPTVKDHSGTSFAYTKAFQV
jgi:hypothetical protein